MANPHSKEPVEYGKPGRFTTYERPYGEIQIRDTKTPTHEIVMVFPTMGGQYSTRQDNKAAKRLARKVVRLLNEERA